MCGSAQFKNSHSEIPSTTLWSTPCSTSPSDGELTTSQQLIGWRALATFQLSAVSQQCSLVLVLPLGTHLSSLFQMAENLLRGQAW